MTKVHDRYFFGVIRLLTRCKICFTLVLFANYFFSKPLLIAFPSKLYESALKLTNMWITSLSFDLNYKFINGSFAFSPG